MWVTMASVELKHPSKTVMFKIFCLLLNLLLFQVKKYCSSIVGVFTSCELTATQHSVHGVVHRDKVERMDRTDYCGALRTLCTCHNI